MNKQNCNLARKGHETWYMTKNLAGLHKS